MSLRSSWQQLPSGVRTTITTLLKAVITVAAFYLLLTHKVTTESGEKVVACAVLPSRSSVAGTTRAANSRPLREVDIVESLHGYPRDGRLTAGSRPSTIVEDEVAFVTQFREIGYTCG